MFKKASGWLLLLLFPICGVFSEEAQEYYSQFGKINMFMKIFSKIKKMGFLSTLGPMMALPAAIPVSSKEVWVGAASASNPYPNCFKSCSKAAKASTSMLVSLRKGLKIS